MKIFLLISKNRRGQQSIQLGKICVSHLQNYKVNPFLIQQHKGNFAEDLLTPTIVHCSQMIVAQGEYHGFIVFIRDSDDFTIFYNKVYNASYPDDFSDTGLKFAFIQKAHVKCQDEPDSIYYYWTKHVVIISNNMPKLYSQEEHLVKVCIHEEHASQSKWLERNLWLHLTIILIYIFYDYYLG
ncbi:unnamed protein product (macronuclear) [Paramecium tetraurelia]|uniref:Uncharacterized protein n=1 Tax=Paramecium tetraurelia TaxID=5888 RepID=A0D698_PARTE|nr:uncharacterized protein GSPATT00039297001 [Paramecium tetraurelia]CAK78565.1 unnamed protein product [Paramecium tetraurelia]|eukprot:XP_001445962.1 hypothetical protein (macronuclear) [Paramecium tetraurelia strain d4-2]